MDNKTAVQELMELDTFLKIMGVTIEWDKYLEKEKEQIENAFDNGKWDSMAFKGTPKEEYYNQTYNQKETRVFGESDDKQFWSDKPNQNETNG